MAAIGVGCCFLMAGCNNKNGNEKSDVKDYKEYTFDEITNGLFEKAVSVRRDDAGEEFKENVQKLKESKYKIYDEISSPLGGTTWVFSRR